MVGRRAQKSLETGLLAFQKCLCLVPIAQQIEQENKDHDERTIKLQGAHYSFPRGSITIVPFIVQVFDLLSFVRSQTREY